MKKMIILVMVYGNKKKLINLDPVMFNHIAVDCNGE